MEEGDFRAENVGLAFRFKEESRKLITFSSKWPVLAWCTWIPFTIRESIVAGVDRVGTGAE